MQTVPRVLLLGALCALGGLIGSATMSSATMPPYHGDMPPALAKAFEDGMFRVPGGDHALRTSTVQPVWYIPVVLASFADQPF